MYHLKYISKSENAFQIVLTGYTFLNTIQNRNMHFKI